MVDVDIILPVYNAEKYIEETINSIVHQSFTNWKLKIIDDASNDSTVNKIKKYLKDERINLKEIKKNKGAGFCRNYALRYSESKYTAFIDSDDIWNEDKLKTQLNFMENNNYDFTYTDFIPFKEKNNVKTFKNKTSLPEKFNYNFFLKNTAILTSTMVIKREKIGLIKFLNTKICEDYFFKCKLLKKINANKCFSKNVTFYRIAKNSLQSSKIRNFYWVWLINSRYNKMNFIKNLLSLLSISINSLKNYGFK